MRVPGCVCVSTCCPAAYAPVCVWRRRHGLSARWPPGVRCAPPPAGGSGALPALLCISRRPGLLTREQAAAIRPNSSTSTASPRSRNCSAQLNLLSYSLCVLHCTALQLYRPSAERASSGAAGASIRLGCSTAGPCSAHVAAAGDSGSSSPASRSSSSSSGAAGTSAAPSMCHARCAVSRRCHAGVPHSIALHLTTSSSNGLGRTSWQPPGA